MSDADVEDIQGERPQPGSPVDVMLRFLDVKLPELESLLRGARELQVYDRRFALCIPFLVRHVAALRTLQEALETARTYRDAALLATFDAVPLDDLIKTNPEAKDRVYAGGDARLLWSILMHAKEQRRT